jgi:hypothetical protein
MQKIARRVRCFGELIIVAASFFIICSAAALAGDVSRKTSANVDWTDIWWDPSEPGWGLQMINTGTFIFVTIYVYGANGLPTWFAGGMTAVPGSNQYTGNLYAATGSYFGGPFTGYSPQQVGTVTFVGNPPDTGHLTYSVFGVSVAKAIQRQPLTSDNYSGTYAAVASATLSGCTNPAFNGNFTTALVVQITQSGNSMSVNTADLGGATCAISGAYSQLGRNGRLQGTYTCSTGDTGTALLVEMNNHVGQFSAQWALQSTVIGCLNVARITGVSP